MQIKEQTSRKYIEGPVKLSPARKEAQLEINEVYAFFGRPRLHDNKIKRIEVTLEELRSCLLPGGIRYDKDRVDSSPKNQMEEVMARIDELERELEEEQKKKQCAVLDIDKSLMKVPEGPYKTLLAEYYIGRISINKIADGMGVSVRHCFRMRKKAVETFCEIMNKDSQTSQDASAEVTTSK